MPATRSTLSTDEKRAAIVEIARRVLLDGGHDALSVAAIARELGVAQNSVYWYFPSRDELFVAALEALLADVAARKPSRSTDVVRRILWFTDESAALWALRGAMAERARVSDAVAEFVARLDALLARMLANALRERVPEGDLDLAVASFRATVEGTFAHDLPRAERHRILAFTLRRLMTG